MINNADKFDYTYGKGYDDGTINGLNMAVKILNSAQEESYADWHTFEKPDINYEYLYYKIQQEIDSRREK